MSYLHALALGRALFFLTFYRECARLAQSMQKRTYNKQLTLRFLHRVILFLFTFLIVLWGLFSVGHIRLYTDATQLVILRTIPVTAIVLFTVSVTAFLFELYFIVVKKQRRYMRLLPAAVVGAVFGLVSSVFAITIIIFSKGM